MQADESIAIAIAFGNVGDIEIGHMLVLDVVRSHINMGGWGSGEPSVNIMSNKQIEKKKISTIVQIIIQIYLTMHPLSTRKKKKKNLLNFHLFQLWQFVLIKFQLWSVSM
jgi:hypothetical protein